MSILDTSTPSALPEISPLENEMPIDSLNFDQNTPMEFKPLTIGELALIMDFYQGNVIDEQEVTSLLIRNAIYDANRIAELRNELIGLETGKKPNQNVVQSPKEIIDEMRISIYRYAQALVMEKYIYDKSVDFYDVNYDEEIKIIEDRITARVFLEHLATDLDPNELNFTEKNLFNWQESIFLNIFNVCISRAKHYLNNEPIDVMAMPIEDYILLEEDILTKAQMISKLYNEFNLVVRAQKAFFNRKIAISQVNNLIAHYQAI